MLEVFSTRDLICSQLEDLHRGCMKPGNKNRGDCKATLSCLGVKSSLPINVLERKNAERAIKCIAMQHVCGAANESIQSSSAAAKSEAASHHLSIATHIHLSEATQCYKIRKCIDMTKGLVNDGKN